MRPSLRLGLCSLSVTAIAAFVTFWYADATNVEEVFTKYLIAARNPQLLSERPGDFSLLYLIFVKLLATDAGRILFVQGILHALTALMVSLTTHEITKKFGWMLLSGVIAAMYRPFLTYAGVHEPENLLLFILALTIFVATWLFQRVATNMVVYIVVFCLALLISAAGLIRMHYFLLIPLFALFIAQRLKSRVMIWSIMIITGGLIAGITFSSVKLPMNPGTVFYEGHNPFAGGLTRRTTPLIMELEAANSRKPDYAHEAYRRVAAYASAQARNPALANKYWITLGLEHIQAEPMQFLRLLGKKFLFTLAPFEAHDTFPAAAAEDNLKGKVFFGFWFCIMMLPIIFLAARKHYAEYLPIILPGFLAMGIELMFYASARQRLPLALSVLAMAIPAAHRLITNHSTKVQLSALVTGVALILMVGSLTAQSAIGQKITYAHRNQSTAMPTEGAENFHGAFFHKSLESSAASIKHASQDCFSSTHLAELGALVEQNIDFSENFAIQGNPAYCLMLGELARGNRLAAISLSQKLLNMRPKDPQALTLFMRLNLSRDEYLSKAANQRFAGIDPATVRWLFAEAALFDRDAESAEKILAPLTPYFPELKNRASLIRAKMLF